MYLFIYKKLKYEIEEVTKKKKNINSLLVRD